MRAQLIFPRGLALGVLLALVAGCATTAKAPRSSAPPEPYMRTARTAAGALELQVAARQFMPARGQGPVIWLVGASHIGESNYFAALQKHLDAQALVLFEGVGRGDGFKPPGRRTQPPKEADDDEQGSIQTTLARSLGLEFQLEAIDYDRPNFRNSDMSVQQIQEVMLRHQPPAQPGEPREQTEFQKLMGVMDGSSFLGALLQTGLKLIGSSPRLQALTKLVFIETLGQLKGDISQMQGVPEEMRQLLQVLIQERNQIVMRDLAAVLHQRRPPASIAIFYGAGHLDDMQRRLRDALHYYPAGQQWFAAFSINAEAVGVSETEISLVRGLVKWQMDQMQAKP